MTSPMFRRVLAGVALLVLIAAGALGYAQIRVHWRIDRVVRLLDAGKATEALTQAQQLADSFGDDDAARRALSAALVRWADGRPVKTARGGGLDYRGAAVTASVYLQAGRITPDMPTVYTGLARLSKAAANGELYDILGISRQAIDIWQSCPNPDSLIQSDTAVREAIVRFVRTGGSYELQAKFMPDDVDTQYWAAISAQMNGDNAKARQYAQRLQALLGDVPQVRVLLGYVCDWQTAKVRTVADQPAEVPNGPRPVPSDLWPAAVSGRWLYYQRVIDDSRVIERLSLGGGKPELLAEGVSPGFAVSPDGTTLYYARFGIDEACPILALTLADMTCRTVTEVTGVISDLVVSPDGARIAFSGRDGLFTCASSDDSLRLLVPSRNLGKEAVAVPVEPAWSADGRCLAYRWGYYESTGPVEIIDAASGESLAKAGDQCLRPTWAPGDTAKLYYTFAECQSDASSIHLLAIRDGWVASDKVVVDGRVSALASGWSPDVRHVMIQLRPAYVIGEVLPQLWVYDTRDGKLLLLTQHQVRCAAWAEDGTIYCITAEGRLLGMRLGS